MLDGNLMGGLGALFAALSGVAFYLASRHRKILVGADLRVRSSLVGVLLSLASVPLLSFTLAPLAAIFAWGTLLMSALTIVPFLPLLRPVRT